MVSAASPILLMIDRCWNLVQCVIARSWVGEGMKEGCLEGLGELRLATNGWQS